MIDRRLLLRLAVYLQRERGSVTLGQFNPNRDFQLANSRITALVLLASAVIFLAGLALNMLTGQPTPVPVAVDASPFATVKVQDADQAIVLSGETPFRHPSSSRRLFVPVHIRIAHSHKARPGKPWRGPQGSARILGQ